MHRIYHQEGNTLPDPTASLLLLSCWHPSKSIRFKLLVKGKQIWGGGKDKNCVTVTAAKLQVSLC